MRYYPYLHWWRYRSRDFYNLLLSVKFHNFMLYNKLYNKQNITRWVALVRTILFSPLEDKSHIFASPPPPPPQRNDPVGLKLSAVGLKIMRFFTYGALRSKLNIFETRRRIKLKQLSWEFAQTESNSSEIIWRNMTYYFASLWTNYHSKHAPRDEVSIYFPNMQIYICHDYVFPLLFGIL